MTFAGRPRQKRAVRDAEQAVPPFEYTRRRRGSHTALRLGLGSQDCGEARALEEGRAHGGMISRPGIKATAIYGGVIPCYAYPPHISDAGVGTGQVPYTFRWMEISSNPIPMDSSSHSVVCITKAFALIIDSTFKKCQLQ